MNRLFSRPETQVLEREVLKDQRHQLFDFLIEKGTMSYKLKELVRATTHLQFPNNRSEADLLLIHWYLRIENYLLRHDSKYINTSEKLRSEIQRQFPTVLNNEFCAVLFESETKQELRIAQNFVTYLEQQLTKAAKEKSLPAPTSGLMYFKPLGSKTLSISDGINKKRNLRELFEGIYTEYATISGADFTLKIFNASYHTFQNSYGLLKGAAILKEFVAQNPVRKKPVIQLHSKPLPASVPNTSLQRSIHTNTDSLMRNVLENMMDGVVICNRRGKILKCNSNALLVFGLTKNELKEHTITSLVPSELSQALQHDLETTDPLIKKKVVGTRFESAVSTKNGTPQDYEISITNNYSEGDDTFTLLFKNITGKKETLQSIQEAQRNAERMAHSKATFLSNMSHEIRTPLNVILGLSEILSKSDMSDPELFQKNVKGIDFSAKNLLSIVNDVLDFSKIEAGKLTIQAIDFNLRNVVHNLASGFEMKAREKGVELKAYIDESIPNVVVGDQYRLNQILNNLIGNALKFTQSGTISVSVSRQPTVTNGEVAILFQVKDTGMGIPKDKLQRIFESFYQVENPETAKITGTGLGLAITKELIELQHGSLTAESEVGEGSMFQFTLPFKTSKLTSIAHITRCIERRDEKLQGLRVLVAEDNKMNQFYIKQLLESMKVTVDVAENGKDAIDIFESSEGTYDLILMDMHMPVMDGLEAISILRKLNKNAFKKVPIAACSADVFPESRKNAMKAGIDFYLTKPLNEDAVKEVLYWLLSDDECKPTPGHKNANDPGAKNTRSSQVNLNQLRDTFDNDDEFISSLLTTFIEETPKEFKSLNACMDREFYARASGLAHKMKSSFMNLGMTLHGHHLQQIENNMLKLDGIAEGKKHMKAFSALYHKTLLEVNILRIELKQR